MSNSSAETVRRYYALAEFNEYRAVADLVRHARKRADEAVIVFGHTQGRPGICFDDVARHLEDILADLQPTIDRLAEDTAED